MEYTIDYYTGQSNIFLVPGYTYKGIVEVDGKLLISTSKYFKVANRPSTFHTLDSLDIDVKKYIKVSESIPSLKATINPADHNVG